MILRLGEFVFFVVGDVGLTRRVDRVRLCRYVWADCPAVCSRGCSGVCLVWWGSGMRL